MTQILCQEFIGNFFQPGMFQIALEMKGGGGDAGIGIGGGKSFERRRGNNGPAEEHLLNAFENGV